MSTRDKAKNAAEKATAKLRNNSAKRQATNPLKPKAKATRPKATSRTPGKRSKTPSKSNARHPAVRGVNRHPGLPRPGRPVPTLYHFPAYTSGELAAIFTH